MWIVEQLYIDSNKTFYAKSSITICDERHKRHKDQIMGIDFDVSRENSFK